MPKISASILSADLSRLGEEIKSIERAGADYIHIDVMDGHFVPNITFGPWVLGACRKATKLPLDVHLMVADPLTLGPVFAKGGAHIVSIHVEATPHLHKGLCAIREAGALSGATLNPSTPIEVLTEVLPYVDMVLVMGVNPGFSGQAHIPETAAKVARLRKFLDERSPRHILIEVDGGVTDQNARALAEAGADLLISASYLFGSPDYAKAMARLKA